MGMAFRVLVSVIGDLLGIIACDFIVAVTATFRLL